MSARSRRRRARAEAAPAPSGTRRRRPIRLPLLPMLSAAAALLLLGAAWTTSWAPGPSRATTSNSRFTLEIPASQQRVINSWERFFICYDLLDPNVIDLTLRANQRATGTLDFPGEKVEVELPSPASGAEGQAAATGAEEELIAVRQSVLGSAVPERLAQVRQQCAGGSAG